MRYVDVDAAPANGLAAYRAVLALPGVAALTAVSFLARLPASAAAITLTLHVVLTLDHGYAAAGLVGAAATVGMAIGAPLLGRLVDRRGLRTMLMLTLSAQAVFWGVAPLLSYPALLVGALLDTMAAVIVVFGTELSMIAGLELGGQAGWIPVVNAVWCVASLTGGFLYGAARRSRSLPLLVGCLGATALPVAFAGPWWSYALLLVPTGLLIAPSMAASAETVSTLAPEHARGLVTGLHGSAITIGATVATPLAGLLVDVASPAVAVLTVGGIGIGAAALVGLLGRPRRRQETAVTPSAGSQPI